MMVRVALLVVLLVALGSCRVNDMRCPKPKVVKLNKRPSNYMHTYYRSLAASAEEKPQSAKYQRPKSRPVKSAENIEEWDCPRPGERNQVPKAVKANIRKNRKRMDEYYRSREQMDTVELSFIPR